MTRLRQSNKEQSLQPRAGQGGRASGAAWIIALGSLLVRRPFTLQYAIESVPVETAATPGFLRANYIITAAWTAATLLMMAANIVLLYVPGLPIWLGLAIALAARNSAIYFTKWYPEYQRIKHPAPADLLTRP